MSKHPHLLVDHTGILFTLDNISHPASQLSRPIGGGKTFTLSLIDYYFNSLYGKDEKGMSTHEDYFAKYKLEIDWLTKR